MYGGLVGGREGGGGYGFFLSFIEYAIHTFFIRILTYLCVVYLAQLLRS